MYRNMSGGPQTSFHTVLLSPRVGIKQRSKVNVWGPEEALSACGRGGDEVLGECIADRNTATRTSIPWTHGRSKAFPI